MDRQSELLGELGGTRAIHCREISEISLVLTFRPDKFDGYGRLFSLAEEGSESDAYQTFSGAQTAVCGLSTYSTLVSPWPVSV